MILSLYRIFTIGRNTLVEAVRQKVLNVLLIFGLVVIGASVMASQLIAPGLDTAGVFDAQIKIVKDFGCGAIGLFGFWIAVLSTALLIPQELHNRTIYTILAKPVRRSEFLLGKFFGVILLLALTVALMSVVFGVMLYWQEVNGLAAAKAQYANVPNWEQNQYLRDQYHHDVNQIVSSTRDPQTIEAILLIFAKLVMTAGIALLISTFATSWIFTVISTIMIYLIGHLEGTAREFWLARGAELSLWQNGLIGLISLLIPDMNSFTITDEMLAGNHIPWSQTLNLLGYADIYLVVLLGVSVVIFDYREI